MYGLGNVKTSFIYINSQKDLNSLSLNINNLIKRQYKYIEVIFMDGTYYFNERNKLSVSNTDCSITFRAQNKGNVWIVSDGEDYSLKKSIGIYKNRYKVKLKSALDLFSTFQSSNNNTIPLSDTGFLNDTLHTNISDNVIELTDSINKIVKLKLPSELLFLKNKTSFFFKNKLICYKAQWADCCRPILYSDREYIYFHINDYLYKNFSTFVSSMFAWTAKRGRMGRAYQPFYITNVGNTNRADAIYYDKNYLYIPESIKEVHICRYRQFGEFKNITGKINFKNLVFAGTSLDSCIFQTRKFDQFSSGFICVENVKSVSIEDNTIKNFGTSLMRTSNCGEIVVNNNKFVDNYSEMMLELYQKNHSLTFSNNYINNPNRILTGRPSVRTGTMDSTFVFGNEVVNISRTFFLIEDAEKSYVYDNELYNTPEMNKYHVRNFSSDTGVFYHFRNKWAEIRNNIIHDLPSNVHYTGIMVDQGSGNTIIKGNLMYNIGDEAIYCWRNPGIKNSNAGNVMESNIILGNVNYGGYDKNALDNASYKDNIFMNSPEYKVLNNSLATDKGGNLFIDSFEIKDKKIRLPQNAYEKVMKDKNIDYFIKQRMQIFKYLEIKNN